MCVYTDRSIDKDVGIDIGDMLDKNICSCIYQRWAFWIWNRPKS